ncbi:hypothetical protein J9332_38775, partial [Aquimarina celericrescens]|nr:hypothetical protein [Aquimarina celericrescens]
MKNTNLINFTLKHSVQKFSLLICTVFMLSPYVNFAQDELARHYTKYDITLKPEGINNKSNSEVITQSISEKGATWLRLFFKDVNLGAKSTVTITSVLDGATQTLTAE